MRILEGVTPRYEDHHKVKILPEAIEAAVRLSSRYINDRRLPDKAIDLIDEAASAVRLQHMEPPEDIRNLTNRRDPGAGFESRRAPYALKPFPRPCLETGAG